MTFGQVLDRIFGLLRRGFWPFVGIASVPAAGAFLLYAAMMAVMLANRNAFIQVPPFPDAFIRLIFEISLAATLPLAAIFAIYAAAASWAATQADLGVKAGFREAYGIALRRAGRYLGLMALIAAIAAAPMMLIEFGMFGSIVPLASGQGVPNFGLFALFPVGILLSMVWGILVGLRLALAFPAWRFRPAWWRISPFGPPSSAATSSPRAQRAASSWCCWCFMPRRTPLSWYSRWLSFLSPV
jgi:hypothetical protein